ncbi:MAG: DUF1653 domain-containing protein [Patescibacteria group bacterium]|nr:MAG: DUF1653 domain-containing protein [Patescibacteria group bacterium]
MRVITENGRSCLSLGEFIHSETRRLHYPLTLLYEPYPQLLATSLRAVLSDWSRLVMPAFTVPPGIYRHFKGGNMYKVFGEFLSPNDGTLSVAYMALYAPYARLVRPSAAFAEHVVKPEHNYEGPRFALVRPC